jgi:hypothetical protein
MFSQSKKSNLISASMIGPGTDGEAAAVDKRQRPYDYGRRSKLMIFSFSLYS